MSECNHDCSSCSANCGERQQPQDLIEKLNPKSSVKKVVAIVSGKGGVGKSLVTTLTACEMNRRGKRVAILDADITGPSIPRAFGITKKAISDGEVIYPATTKGGIDIMSINLLLENAGDPVVWRGPVIASAVKQFWGDVLWQDIDYMFIDMPPGTGDVPLTVFQSIPVDGIIIVTSPQELVSMIVEKAARMAEMMNVPILGLVENMSYIECSDCGKKISVFGESHIDEIAAAHNTKVLGKLPIKPEIAAAVDAGAIEGIAGGDWIAAAVDAVESL
ncbi:MAG: Mrp/NBP35 family ATP-binding protein [Oscillospiraceae bacterium]|nr:Mrp/NBP35 family ATP-binding protein [Oscillospiraceae bacterium]MBP1557239.1 Mrp/NBP35 family ATP-binding protein [Oscillospiraceae bacterium]